MEARDFIQLGMGIVMFILGAWIKDWGRRMVALEEKKADKAEVSELHDEVRRSINDTTQINVAIARLTEQMARVVADIESEKRTRADANKAILEQMLRMEKNLSERIQQSIGYGRRKGDIPQ